MEKAFLTAIDQHQNILHKVCRLYRDKKEDQEDLFQEIIFQLWKSFPKFRKEAKISTWMYRIALSTAISVFRKASISIDFKDSIPENLHPAEKSELSENEEQLFEALRKLNEAERAIIALYLEDYSHKEIGDIVGISENYMGVKISRIKNRLRDILAKPKLPAHS
ncbi:sigma-70 family RNA polymerase sigma factor [Marivirga sp. S37H4]|uniref:Sigma-70 family RNA polymerase sigma factor n=1 Tax=Marivirga aurantiaca TaxID=2802615 RepID=A0A934WZI6_9BACT|nr:sigma-70 family RNA polymerase sigma factor [Marivirga aurantiaca]MBK6265651.1 sigma-70 family RNA polymerase sigma factor [Marivirga aurantiaca]